MANPENLIPVTKRTPREQRAISSKGGKVRSPGKKLASKIRELKKKGLSNTNAKELLEVMLHSELSILDLRKRMEKLYDDCTDPKEKAVALRLLTEWHKTHHGSKDSTKVSIQQNTLNNVQVNIVMPPEEKE